MNIRIIVALICPFAIGCLISAAELEPGAWTSFRGTNRDGLSEARGLLRSWPEGGPPLLWTNDAVGLGLGSPIAAGGVVYLTGSRGLVALDARSGVERWRADTGKTYSTPTLVDGRIYLQVNGVVSCHAASDGRPLWRVDVMEVLPKTEWKDATGYGSWHGSPLVDNGKVVVVTGHPQAPVVALNARTGKEMWRATGAQAASSRGGSSPIAVTCGTTRIILAQTNLHLLGIDAETGAVLWERMIMAGEKHRPPSHPLCNVPLYAQGIVYATSGYGYTVGRALRLGDNGRSVTEIWTSDLIRPFQESMICVDGKIYGYNHGNLIGQSITMDSDFLLNGKPFTESKSQLLCVSWSSCLTELPAVEQEQADLSGPSDRNAGRCTHEPGLLESILRPDPHSC